MKNASRKLTMLGTALSLLIVAGCGGGGGAEEEDTPEANAFRYRQAVMRVLAGKMGPIGAMAREEVPLDEAAFAKMVEDLRVVSGMVTEGFETEGIAGGSAALPAIWSDMDDFDQRAADLQSAVNSLAEAVADGGFASGQGLVQSTAQNCGGCHRVYRARDEE